MSARRSALLTLASVILVAALVAGGLLGYRAYGRYNDAIQRAKTAERELRARPSAHGQLTAAEGRGFENGYEAAFEEHRIEVPGWYVIKVVTAGDDALRPGWLEIAGRTRMTVCRPYWYDEAGEVWHRTDNEC